MFQVETHIAAQWATDKYSTRTSRPWFSSFRNSWAQLQPQNTWVTHLVTIHFIYKFNNNVPDLDCRYRLKNKHYSSLTLCSWYVLESHVSLWSLLSLGPILSHSPNMISPQGYLQLSEDLSGFLHTSLKLTEHKYACYELSDNTDSEQVKQMLMKVCVLTYSGALKSIDTNKAKTWVIPKVSTVHFQCFEQWFVSSRWSLASKIKTDHS